MSLKTLMVRRNELIQQIARQRDDIALLTHSIEGPLRFVDQGYAILQKMKHQPKFVLAGTFLLAIVFHKPLLRKSATIVAITQWFLLKK